MESSKIIAFAAAQRVSESRSFYRDVLNLTEIEETPFALVFETNGTTLRIQKVDTVVTTPYTTLGWEVEDISSTIKDLLAKGVQVNDSALGFSPRSKLRGIDEKPTLRARGKHISGEERSKLRGMNPPEIRKIR